MRLPRLEAFTYSGQRFRDGRTIPDETLGGATAMLSNEAIKYPPQLYCKGGARGRHELGRLMEERGLTRPEALDLLNRWEATRHAVTDYFGDIHPVTFVVMESGNVMGAWQLWGIRELPASTPQNVVVRARPFPAFPELGSSELASAVVGLMDRQLGMVQRRVDGGTFEVREWELFLVSPAGERTEERLEQFEAEYLALSGVQVERGDADIEGRRRWRLRR